MVIAVLFKAFLIKIKFPELVKDFLGFIGFSCEFVLKIFPFFVEAEQSFKRTV